MRVILDTNILISALLIESGIPGRIYQTWTDGAFTLILSDEQLREMKQTLTKPYLWPVFVRIKQVECSTN